ncbi:PIN domain-containing protein [Flavobacterium sp. ov086]|uniref:PIN domain-containing protein n=1 Tax=Flavobacterium sp. ov086 TaxID=1761785 RepID=UPI000B69D88A|nr:PIN domain-containing protein [Flavobacterium sp. ov086]SNR25082.1 hypothetical protein SAMN04487979_101392 [Flavobacterium sp. ov086]
MEIETDIVFIDTGIFERENFLRGHKIKKISELSKSKAIKVKLTDITYREIKNRMRKNLETARVLYKKFGDTINVDAKILKNDADFNNFYPLKKLDTTAIFKKLEIQLDDFIKDSEIEIIDSSLADIQEVFEQYFEQKAPFHEGQKKDEFPDAFTLSAIKQWCKKNKKKVYIISTDNDIIKYKDEPSIIPLHDLTVFIDTVSRKHESEKIVQKIMDSITGQFDVVKNYLIENYNEEIGYQISQNYIHQFDVLEYDETPIIEKIELENIYFSDIGKDSSTVQIVVNIYLELNLSYIDYDMATYDREDDIWFNANIENLNLVLNTEFEFEASFEYEFDETELIDIQFTGIDNLEINDITNLGD